MVDSGKGIAKPAQLHFIRNRAYTRQAKSAAIIRYQVEETWPNETSVFPTTVDDADDVTLGASRLVCIVEDACNQSVHKGKYIGGKKARTGGQMVSMSYDEM